MLPRQLDDKHTNHAQLLLVEMGSHELFAQAGPEQ
jgi:hypothetical protein